MTCAEEIFRCLTSNSKEMLCSCSGVGNRKKNRYIEKLEGVLLSLIVTPRKKALIKGPQSKKRFRINKKFR